MKTAPNREQFLFLVAGGIILGLILVVVVFNMMGSSSSNIKDEEANVRPVVTLPPQKGGVAEKSGAAAVFGGQGLPTLPEEVPVQVTPDLAIRSDHSPSQANPVVPPTRSEARVEKKPESRPESSKTVARPEAKTLTKPEAKPVTKPEPAKTEAKPEPAKTEAKPEPAKTVAKPEPAKTVTKPEPTKTMAKVEPAPPKAGAAGGRFAVNMGAFKEESRAVSHKNKLAALGLPVYLQETTSKAGTTFHRVRLGPYATHADADAASRSAKEKSGSAGSIVAYGQ